MVLGEFHPATAHTMVTVGAPGEQKGRPLGSEKSEEGSPDLFSAANGFLQNSPEWAASDYIP